MQAAPHNIKSADGDLCLKEKQACYPSKVNLVTHGAIFVFSLHLNLEFLFSEDRSAAEDVCVCVCVW